ncbi:hypothetical protein [Paraburkholderia tropica]|uniref:hypothetical protein n=1 Tax=Paraburkholderia tropica TaxID=92647 RepID=UPI002AB7A4CB|nr:hypothetical protein [Paraburkholderia tropica]
MTVRLFAGVSPTGILYADRHREEHGDYAHLAFLCFAKLELQLEPGCPRELQATIAGHAAQIQARRGEAYRISSTGQTVTLGHALG